MTSREPLLSTKEVAKRLGVSDRTVRNYIDSGRLHAIQCGRLVRVPVEAIDQFLRPYQTKSHSPVSVALSEHERDLIALREEHGLSF